MKLSDIFQTASTDHGLELFSDSAIKAIEALLTEKKGKPVIIHNVTPSINTDIGFIVLSGLPTQRTWYQ